MSQKTERNASLPLDLPYITPQLPGIGGTLRARPDHFIVEEIPLYAPGGEGQHLYVNLTKVGLTTKDVQHQLAQLFDVKRSAVGFAGMKDKQAQTTQTFSLPLGHITQGEVDEAARRIADNLPNPSVTLNWVERHKNKLKPGHLLGNRFRITVSGLELAPDDAVGRANAIAEKLRAHGAPNYFGPQRFGMAGDNAQRGREILLGTRRSKDRWLRRFLVSAYQSYLCNQYLARRVEIDAFHRLLPGDIAKKYDTGGIFDVDDVAVEQPRYANHEISFTAPIYGPKMREPDAEAAALENEVLATAAVTLEQFRAARVQGTRRLGRLLLPDLQVERVKSLHNNDTFVTENSEKHSIMITFSLPKGAFATTILREIMKQDVPLDVADDSED